MHDSAGEFPRLFQYKSVFSVYRATMAEQTAPRKGEVKNKIGLYW